MRRLLLVLVGVFIVYFVSCSENPVDVSETLLLDPAYQSQFFTDTLYAVFDTTYQTTPVENTLESSRILVGSTSGFTFRPIMKFSFIPNKFRVQHAEIRFISTGITGENPQPFEVTAYPILQEWESNTDSLWSNYQANIDFSRPMGNMTITSVDTDTMVLVISDTTLLNFWADSAGYQQNYGFILDFSNANFVKSFKADNFMQLTFILPGDTTVKSDSATIVDAFLIENNFTPAPDRDYVSTLSSKGTILNFDFSPLLKKFPEGIIINSANLQLGIDWDNTLFNPKFKANLWLLRLTSQLKSSKVEIDSSLLQSNLFVDLNSFSEDSSYIEVKAGNERVELAQGYVQQKMREPESMTGYYIEFKNRIDFLSYLTFFKRDATDISKRPRLILEFMVPPKPRF